MKILTAAVLAAALVAPAGLALSGDAKDKELAAKNAKNVQTFTGELTDATCYLNIGRHGAEHAECAAKCLKNGYPMAVLTADNSLLLVVPDPGSEKVYKDAAQFAAKQVVVTGIPSERSGMKSLALQTIQLADASATEAAAPAEAKAKAEEKSESK